MKPLDQSVLWPARTEGARRSFLSAPPARRTRGVTFQTFHVWLPSLGRSAAKSASVIICEVFTSRLDGLAEPQQGSNSQNKIAADRVVSAGENL